MLLKRAEKKADIIEIWVDALKENVRPEEIIASVRKPLIIVNKSRKEKGGFRGSDGKRVKILENYLRAGAGLIDASMDIKPALLKKLCRVRAQNASRGKKSKIILSWHNFRKTPSLKILKKMRDRGFRHGADIVKIATYANGREDNLKILNLLADSSAKGKPVIAFCMGEYGRISRVLAPQFGSYIIYVALDPEHKTAPGQLTVNEYKKITSLLEL